jgi:predicted amidohydrolase YtcJ
MEENVKGSIERGKLGDLVVLSKDIFHIDPVEIQNARVDMTIFDGRVVFERK